MQVPQKLQMVTQFCFKLGFCLRFRLGYKICQSLGRKGHLACGDRSSTPVRAACVDSTGGHWSEHPGSFPCTWSTAGEARIRFRVARSSVPHLQVPAGTGVVLATFLAALAVVLRVVLAVAVLARPAVARVAVPVALAPATADLLGSNPYRLGGTRSSLTNLHGGKRA